MPEPTLDALLQHSRWVSSLAVSLARDPGLADDLVQEAWVQVLRRGPKDDRSPRGWLATLLRRQLRQMRRGEERRLAREQSHARDTTQASTAEVVERAELHKSLVQAVLDLREPFRTTVLLRYLEERSPEEIAGLTGVPVATVHSRLGRGLAALRTRLGKKHEDGAGLYGLLLWLPVGQPRRLVELLRQEALALTAFGVGLVLLGALTVSLLSDEAQPEPVAALVVAAGEESPTRAPLAPAPLSTERIVGRIPLEVPPLRETLAVAVVDRRGEPVPGVSVALVEDGGAARLLHEGQSQSDGRVLVPVPPARAILRSRDPRYESAFAAVVVPWSTREPTLVVAPRIAVAGRVLDDTGAPIADAEVRLWIDPLIPVAQARPLDSSGPVLDLVRTDAHGAFAFPSMAALEEAAFTVHRAGHGKRIFAAPLASRSDLELVLDRPRNAPVVRGVVRDEFGRPAVGARVAAHPLWTHADEAGRFELLLGEAPAQRLLTAVLPGEAQASVALVAPEGDPDGWPDWVELELTRAELAFEGFVRDEFGRAVPGARVWLADPTPAGLELVGASSIEALRAGSETCGWFWVESDARGAFRLPGVFAREYRVRAADPRTLVAGEVRATPGAPLEIVLGEELLSQALTGRVVDDEGVPLADVRVALVRPFFRVQADGEATEESLYVPTLTDADGRFSLPRCPREGTRLDLGSDGTLHMGLVLDRVDASQPLELVVSRRAYVRVELAEPRDRADSMALVDGEGRPRSFVLMRAWCPHLYPRAPLVEGRSLVFAATMLASEVVFYRGEEEVGRAPLRLRPGELTVLRW